MLGSDSRSGRFMLWACIGIIYAIFVFIIQIMMINNIEISA